MWQLKMAKPNLICPNNSSRGVSDHGINPHGKIHPMTNSNMNAWSNRTTASELDVESSCSRLDSYQIFRTRERRCSIPGRNAIRTNPASIRKPRTPRIRRPEVTTHRHSTTKRPWRFNAQHIAASSAPKSFSSKPPVATNALRVQNMKAPPPMPGSLINKPNHHNNRCA